MLYLVDSSPYSSSSHSLEYREGFKTAAKVTIERDGDEWHMYSVFTHPDYRGRGLAKALVEEVEGKYGKVKIQSEADGFWQKVGFRPCRDGFWRRVEDGVK